MNLFLRANLIRALVFVLLNDIFVTRGARTKPKLVQYSIPENRALKMSLGFSQDTYLNFTELVTKYGYPNEEHNVITEDGYVLTVFRILSKCSEVQLRFHPVLLVHGLMDSSDLWILPGQDNGLGYVFANECYDVWVINHRGNRYSRKHVRLDPDTDVEYWNFSFDEFGNYDVPAVVDYILYTTKRPRLYFIGHSQGTTNFFAMNSLRPQYNNKIRLSIHLAPIAWFKHFKSPLPLLLAQNTEPLIKILEAAGYNEILARDQILHTLLEFLCQTFPDEICGEIFRLTTGYKVGTIDKKTWSIAMGHLIAGASVKTLAHLGQLIKSKKFQRYDEGKIGNIKRYGSPNPPNYNLSMITSPVVLINAKNDLVSSLEDINILRSKLPNVVENYVVPEKYWSHHNHLWGIKAPTRVFSKILNYCNEFDGYRIK